MTFGLNSDTLSEEKNPSILGIEKGHPIIENGMSNMVCIAMLSQNK
jgi:hypothetical protein